MVSRASDGRRGQGGADALEGPGGQEHPAGRRRTRRAASSTEKTAMPDQEGPAPAEEVARAGAEEQQAAEGEDVGVEDPRELAAREAEARLDVGQRDVDDGGVEHDHELGGQDHEQEHRGVPEQAPGRPGGPGGGSPAAAGRGATRVERALTSTFPLVSLVSGSFLRLVYGGCLRFASLWQTFGPGGNAGR